MTKNKLSFNLEISASKFLAYCIFITGSVYSFLFKDPQVFMFCSGIAAGLHGLKSWSDSSLEKKKAENPPQQQNPPIETPPPVI